MCQHLTSTINTCLAESTLVLTLVCVVWSSVGSRGSCVGPPSLSGTGVPWVSCLDEPVCLRVQGDSVAKRQPLCVLAVGVVASCVLCARGRGRVPRACATENTYTPARLEALFKLSVVTILRHSYHFHQIFCGMRHPVRDLIELFLLVVCSVASHLVHVNVSLFLFWKIDQFRMLSRLSLDFTVIFATGYTLNFVSAVL